MDDAIGGFCVGFIIAACLMGFFLSTCVTSCDNKNALEYFKPCPTDGGTQEMVYAGDKYVCGFGHWNKI